MPFYWVCYSNLNLCTDYHWSYLSQIPYLMVCLLPLLLLLLPQHYPPHHQGGYLRHQELTSQSKNSHNITLYTCKNNARLFSLFSTLHRFLVKPTIWSCQEISVPLPICTLHNVYPEQEAPSYGPTPLIFHSYTILHRKGTSFQGCQKVFNKQADNK